MLLAITVLPLLAAPASAGPAEAITSDGLQISAAWNAITDAETGAWWSADATGAITVGIGEESWPWDSPEAKPVMNLLADRIAQANFTPGEAAAVAPTVGILVDADGDRAIYGIAVSDEAHSPWGQVASAPAWLGDAEPVSYGLQSIATVDGG